MPFKWSAELTVDQRADYSVMAGRPTTDSKLLSSTLITGFIDWVQTPYACCFFFFFLFHQLWRCESTTSNSFIDVGHNKMCCKSPQDPKLARHLETKIKGNPKKATMNIIFFSKLFDPLFQFVCINQNATSKTKKTNPDPTYQNIRNKNQGMIHKTKKKWTYTFFSVAGKASKCQYYHPIGTKNQSNFGKLRIWLVDFRHKVMICQ